MRTPLDPGPSRRGIAASAILALSFVLALASAPPAMAAGPSGTSGAYDDRADHPVVISEIAAGWMDRPDAGFVELQNVSDAPVDLTGWNLYRCNEEGLRAKRGVSDADFSGVILQPGEHYVLARAGERPGRAEVDESLYVGFGALGVGYVLEDPDELIADRVAVYPTTPWMTTSECDPDGSLPNTLDLAAGESWQRFDATTGDDGRFAIAIATPGRENQLVGADVNRLSGIVIAEVAPFGPSGSGDDLVELRNDGDTAQSLRGWTLWRCTATGVRSADTLQAEFEADDVLDPGERLVIAGPTSRLRSADVAMATSLADLSFGVQIRDATGALVDEVAVAHQRDSACQSGPEKLPAVLDAVRGESYQRLEGASTWIIAPRTPGARNARDADALAEAEHLDTGVVVSEFATDPLDVAAIATPHNFVELTNRSDRAVAVDGWQIWACDERGLRRPEPLATLGGGARLEAGESIVFAAAATAAAASASAQYAEPLHFLGAGVMVLTADGRIADRVGAYHVNEMDESIEPPSPCTNAVSLVTFQPDRVIGETYHRVDRTGVDLVDFRTTRASPGLDGQAALTRTLRLTDHHTRLLAAPAPVATTSPIPTDVAPLSPLGPDAPSSDAVRIVRTVVGTTGAEPARAWDLDRERIVAVDTELNSALATALGTALAEAEAQGWEYPATRFELDEAVSGTITWSGQVSPRHRVVLAAWGPGNQWVTVGEGQASATGAVAVTGDIASPTLPDGTTALLVQVLPSPRTGDERAPNGTFERPDAIDATIVHFTDTQYLSEGYPEEYERMAHWIVELSQRRDLAAVVHTGDLVQSWVDPDQTDARARIEFERASVAQGILESAGLVTTVLPGNHDTKRGIETDLYNEYFGVPRVSTAPGFVSAIAPNDATSSYTITNAGGAPVLILSIGYGYGERELAWAERVVAAHPDHNIIVATHEHLTPLTLEDPSRRASSNRWVSRADELWQRVIAPNRHVVAVLAGHYHGLGAIITPNAGGIEGHDVVELLADYQEFRTDSGERATGFLRLLQLDLAAGVLAVDTYSPRLDATVSAPFDAVQFRLENGDPTNAANGRPWNIIAIEREDRYGIDDDEFTVDLSLQYEKSMTTSRLTLVPVVVEQPQAGGAATVTLAL